MNIFLCFRGAVDDVAQKVGHLRTSYARELAKAQKSMSTASMQPHKSNWLWFKKIDEFLHCHMIKLARKVSRESKVKYLIGLVGV